MDEVSSVLGDVAIDPLRDDVDFPLVIRPSPHVRDVVGWSREHQEPLRGLLHRYGAILFRGFPIGGAGDFERLVGALCTEDWVEYREAATPRSHVRGHVFTSTEYYPELRIYVHNENSHVTSWPLYLFFHCRTPAAEGGYTPLADCRRVLARLPRELVERFARTGWLYQRNFHPNSSISWQKAFGTSSREELERYCQENYMVARWNGNHLSVRYRRWAMLQHPQTGEVAWFNHGTFFNPFTLEPALRTNVLAMGTDKMPYNTGYGDGSSVDEETIRTLDEAYAEATISFPWQAGDVLMLDNMRIAHGRTPYKGKREVLVAMKRRIRCETIAPPEQYAPPA